MRIENWKHWQIGILVMALYILAWWGLMMWYGFVYEPTETKEIFTPRVTWEGQPKS